MRYYLLEDIVRDTRLILDLNLSSEILTEIGDVDTLSTDEVIRSKVVDAVKRVHCEAPAHLLDGGHNFGDAVYWKDNVCGWVLLPEDFMRFVVFEMDDWACPVFVALDTDHPLYVRQSSRFHGLRGNPQRPLCFISVRPEGRVLEFYSCKSQSALVSRGVYLPYPGIDANGGIEICMRCYDAVVYTTAALASTAFGDVQNSATFFDLAKSVLL